MSQSAVQIPRRKRMAVYGLTFTSSDARLAVTLSVPVIALFTTEWIHRGTLDGFAAVLSAHLWSFALAWLFLQLVYLVVSRLTGFHALAVLTTGIVGGLPAAITYYKLQIRGEPFLPWDISQAAEASAVIGKANIEIQTSMIWTIIIFVVLFLLTFRLREPRRKANPGGWRRRVITGGVSCILLGTLIFGVYLKPAATLYFGIRPDMWMQNRYYRNHGVITGFLSNLQALDISAPDGYSEQAVRELVEQVSANAPRAPRYADSYAAAAAEPEQKPNIIFIMDEAFWNVNELPGITYSEPVTPTLDRLRQTAAVGKSYSPSFGGGTCDVEFEALTGYSVEHLPLGAKPYQQHVTRDMFALPAYLKGQGYDTLAIHGFYRKYWSRDTAYPHLGIDRFVAMEDFVNPERKRSEEWSGGLITDAEMGRRIISEYEQRDRDKPLFIHAVTMQNHSGYNAKNYPQEELVKITSAPDGISQETLSQLQDFATGIREADEMLGTLVDYFSKVDEPTIIVFWGDHYNTIGKGYELYEKTGYIAPGDTSSPNLHGTPLVIWSNYYDKPVDLGTVAAYDISPVMMDLYGLEKPLMFEFLSQEMDVFRARSRGITVNPDGSFSEQMTPEQEQWFDDHWLLQYDMMFGKQYAEKSVLSE